MKTDVAYEVVDYRDAHKPLKGVVLIATSPGTIALIGTGTQEFYWQIPDIDGTLEDDEDHKTVVLNTPEGRIVLVELGQANFQKHIRKDYGPDFPTFDSDYALNQYFYTGILQGIL